MAFADHKDIATHIRHQSRNDVTAQDMRRLAMRHNPDSDNLTANKKLKTMQPFIPKSPSQVMAESEKNLVVTPSRSKIRNPRAKKKATNNIGNTTSFAFDHKRINFLPKCLEDITKKGCMEANDCDRDSISSSISYDKKHVRSNPDLKTATNDDKRNRNLEKEFINVSCPRKLYDESSASTHNNSNKVSNAECTSDPSDDIIGMLYSSSTSKNNSTMQESHEQQNIVIGKAINAIDLLSSKTDYTENNDSINDKKLSFKEEMHDFISEFKKKTGNNNNNYESLIALNSILLNKLNDKIDDIDQKLKSV